jgi:hypothetical protein
MKVSGVGADLAFTFVRLIDSQEVDVFNLEFALPPDHDNDHIADVWERAMIEQWNSQYGAMEDVTDLSFFDPDGMGDFPDSEELDPDGNGPLVDQATEGDHIPVDVEYRGFILDGGGFDAAGANAHPGGHKRLSPARKEALLEVDHDDPMNLPNLPAGGVTDYLEVGARVLSNPVHMGADVRGAGIYMYWVIDDDSLAPNFPAPPAVIGHEEFRDNLEDNRGPAHVAMPPAFLFDVARKYFTHLIIIGDAPAGYDVQSGWSYDEMHTMDTDKRGFYLHTDEIHDEAGAFMGVSDADYGGTALAHEFLHIVIDPGVVAMQWDGNEHFIGNPMGGEVMDYPAAHNVEEENIRIGDETQEEIDLAGNPALTP